MKKKILIKDFNLKKFFFLVSKKLNIPKKEIEYLSKSLIGSSLRGVDSHGVGLFPHYVMNVEMGSIKNKPKMKFIKKMPSVGIIDADNGFGHSASYLASENAVKLAKKNGIGLVGIYNSSHHGASGAYSLDVAKNNCIGLCFTHADSFATPFNGLTKFHGTNPYSFSAPIDKNRFILVDFASTSIPWNKVITAKKRKKKLPKNVALDKFGKITSNSNLASSLLPLGGDLFGHKGFGLASSIDILCGPLLGISHSYELLPMMGPDFKSFRKLGHIVIAIDISSITNKKTYYKNINNYLSDLKKQKSKKNKKILYPGEKEYEEQKIRKKFGIPFDDKLLESYFLLDKKYEINFLKSLI